MRANPRRRRGTARTPSPHAERMERRRRKRWARGCAVDRLAATSGRRSTAIPWRVRDADRRERIQAIARIAIRFRRSNNWNGNSVSSPVLTFSMSMRFVEKARETATHTSVRRTGKPSANPWTRPQFPVATVLHESRNNVPAIHRESPGAADERTLLHRKQGTEVSDFLEEPTATQVSKLPHCRRHAGQALEEAR